MTRRKEKIIWRNMAAALGAAALLPLSAAQAGQIEADIEVPGQTYIIGSEWVDRKLQIDGQGDSNIMVYSKNLGGLTNLGIDGGNNFVSIYGGYYDGIMEGNAVNVTGNVINVREGAQGWLVYEDASHISDAHRRIHIFDNSGQGLAVNVIAGHAGLGEASNNTINLYGGMVNGYIIAAEGKKKTEDTAAGRLHDNTVNIFGQVDMHEASLFGAAIFDDADRSRNVFMGTNNTLNTYVKDVDVNELGGFNNYNFYLPMSVKNQDIMINVNGDTATDISGSSIMAYVPSSPYLQVDDKVNLIINKSGITDSQATTYRGVNADTGLTHGSNASAEYDIITEKQDESHVIVRLKGRTLKPVTKHIPQSKVPTLVNRGGDFMAGGGADSAEMAGAQVYTPFFAGTGSSMRYTTGSHVDMRGYSLVIGMSKRIENEKRRLLIAPMLEYGHGHYDAYLDGGTKGKGGSQYFGAGLVFRNTRQNGFFYEGSVRGGRLKTDFTSKDFSVGGRTLSESFRSSSGYWGLHLGAGRELPWQRKGKFMYYGKLFYTHNAAEDITLSTGDEYHLSSVDSLRLRIGGKYTYQADEKHKFYLGLAWEHEFDGSSYAVYHGLRTDEPRLKGDSGMVELGWNYKPQGNDKFSIDLSAIGWFGRQRGITGRLGLNWMF